MKHLYLLRHGKSDWSAASRSDHERPLAPRGRKAAALVGRTLAERGEVPERIVSSTALRARSTAERAAKAGGWGCSIEVTERLYLPSAAAVLEEVRAQPASATRVMLVGHEPTWSEAVGLFAGLSGDGGVRMVTAAVARLDFAETEWDRVELGAATLAWLLTPKLLAAARDAS